MSDYNADPEKGGVKHDADKNRLELLSVVALEQIGLVATHGSVKYAPNQWRKGMSWARLVGASMRHLFAFARGEDLDPDSGLPHLAHAGWCVMALIEFQQLGNGEDDRWRMPPQTVEGREKRAVRDLSQPPLITHANGCILFHEHAGACVHGACARCGVKLTIKHLYVRSGGALTYCSDVCGRAAGLPEKFLVVPR